MMIVIVVVVEADVVVDINVVLNSGTMNLLFSASELNLPDECIFGLAASWHRRCHPSLLAASNPFWAQHPT